MSSDRRRSEQSRDRKGAGGVHSARPSRRRPIRALRRRRLRIVITAGPTREFLDSVRFISNPSSGKMGYAVAEAALAAGHEVTLLTGPVDLEPPSGAKIVRVITAAEMAAAAKRAFARADAAVLAAAVCDYRPVRRARRKLPKKVRPFALALAPTVDIAALLGRMKGDRVTIGFALEDHDGRRHAGAKMVRKNCDAIVLNGPESVGSDVVSVEFLARGQRWERWREESKRAVAGRLVQAIERLTSRESRRPVRR
jgi:phosphopantothenoylcysteine decarboxylase/phosphopantothenate--cysteine ligase